MEQVVTASTQTNAVVYAGFWRRWTAVFLDSLVLGVLGFVVSFVLSLGLALMKVDTNTVTTLNQIISVLISWVYVVWMTRKYGQTWGKKWMHIKIVDLHDDTSTPSWPRLLLRESVGKFVSSIVFGLGYLWMIRDSHKQTWHDKMSKTVVIRI